MISHQDLSSIATAELFTCELCPKSFNTLGRYNQHKKTHSKPYRCDHCDKGFALRLDLRRHAQARHRVGNSRFSCGVDGCNFKATRKDNLLQHGSRQHNQARNINTRKARRITQKPVFAGPTIQIWEAASAGNTAMVRQLLEDKAKISEKAPDGSTVLHCAARAGHQEMVTELLALGADRSARNNADKTPLLEAIRGKSSDATRVLLKNTEKVGEKEVLFEALISGHVEVLRELIEHIQATPLLHGLPKHWELCILHAVRFRQVHIVEYLLTSSLFDPTRRDRMGWNPLLAAAIGGYPEIVQVLLNTGRVEVNSARGWDKMTALHLATTKGHVEVMRLLLDHEDIKTDCRNAYGNTALHDAAYREDLEIVKLLLQHDDVKAGCKNTSGETPLYQATYRGNLEIVKLLLQHDDVKAGCKNTSGETPLYQATYRGNLEIVKLLLQYDDVKAGCETTSGETPLHQAAYVGSLEIVKLLLQYDDVEADCKTTSGETPLHRAAYGGNLEIVKLLLQYDDVKAGCETTSGETPLHSAAYRGDLEIVKLLLQHDDVKAGCETASGETPLHSAAYRGDLEIVKLLLQHDDVKAGCETASGETPLHRAAYGGNLEIVKLLLQYDDVKAGCETISGETPLHQAAYGGNLEIVQLLLQHDDVEADCKTTSGETPLHKAAYRGNLEIVKLLLQYDDVKAGCETTSGETPLHQAAYVGSLEIVKLLLQYDDVEADCKTTSSETPLHRAASQGHAEVVKVLLERKDVDINSRTSDMHLDPTRRNKTALDLARKCPTWYSSKKDTINLLLAHGVKDDSNTVQLMSDTIQHQYEIREPDHYKAEGKDQSGEDDIDMYFDDTFEWDETDAMDKEW